MQKIASPAELQTELKALLNYAQSRQPSRARVAGKLRELSKRLAADGTIDEAYLLEVATLFNKVIAKTRFIMGTPEVKTHGKIQHLKVRLQPYNDAGVNSLDVFVTDGHKVHVSLAGSYVPIGGNVESQGFGQTFAEDDFEYRGEPVARFVQILGKLRMKME